MKIHYPDQKSREIQRNQEIFPDLVLAGTYTETYPNGDIVTTELVNGVENGIRIVKDPNGMCKELYTFRNGILNGEVKIWYTNVHDGSDLHLMTSDCNSDIGIHKKFFMVDGNPHSIDDLPSEIIYEVGGQVVVKKWFKNGVLHRSGDLPAYINYDRDRYHILRWYKNGSVYRDGDLPVQIIFNIYDTIKPNILASTTKIIDRGQLETTNYKKDGKSIIRVYRHPRSSGDFYVIS